MPWALDLYLRFRFIYEVFQGDALEELVNHPVQLIPEGSGLAAGGAGTGCGALGRAGSRGQAALRQLQDAAYRVVGGLAVQAVTAALAVDGIHKIRLAKHRHDGF